MRRLREEAARRRTTMSELVEAGLRRILADASAKANGKTVRSVLPVWCGGGTLVDLSNRAELYSAMEES